MRAIEQLWGPVASEGRVDGRRHNRGRKARRSWLVKEKLRWIERVEVELGGSTAREDIGPAVRRALEAHDYPYIEGDAGRVCGKKRGGQQHEEMGKWRICIRSANFVSDLGSACVGGTAAKA